jgi:hypothetical protein
MIPPICDQCGQPDAQALGDEVLCAACAHERGSCGAAAQPEEEEDETETKRSPGTRPNNE